MKRKLQILTSASAVLFLAFTGVAQQAPNIKPDGAEYTHQSITHVRGDRINDATKASDVIGMTVKNLQNEKLGKVHDLAVDVESGRIVQVILSTGGFLGLGDTLTAVPPGALHHDVASKVIQLDASKEKLKTAPKFDLWKWDESTQSNQVIEAYGYYGEEPYFVANRDIYKSSNTEVNHAVELPRNKDGTISTDGPRTADNARNGELAGNTISTYNADGTSTRERYANGNGAKSSWSSLGYVQQASKLMRTSVKNLQDEKLGKVENFIVDLSAGRIVAVIISTGGFIGMGNELSAVPPTALRFNAEHDILQLDASKEMLAGSPHFKANEWPDLSQPDYAGGVYRAYKVEPYFTTDGTTDADNTRQNVRDRDNRTLTPLDQGNSQADVSTTAQIRKGILADKGMSVNAKNVKIITKNGQVTLRGPVNTAEEKRHIEEIANRIGRSANVNSQLEVTQSSTSSSN
jgi:hyperosmotically inducible periplasmic protein